MTDIYIQPLAFHISNLINEEKKAMYSQVYKRNGKNEFYLSHPLLKIV